MPPRWAAAKAEQKGTAKPKADGALTLLAEAAPYPRVRVARAEMEADQHGQSGRLGEATAGHHGLVRLRSKA